MRTIQAECTVVRDVLCPRNMPQRLTESQGARNVQRDVELCSREFEIMYVGAARKYSFIDRKKSFLFADTALHVLCFAAPVVEHRFMPRI